MNQELPLLIEGDLVRSTGSSFAIVATRFNELVVDKLLDGALSAFSRHGVARVDVLVVRVPGAFELSPACLRLCQSQRFDAVVALGCVIRGATAHFDYVAGEAARGVAHAGSVSGVPAIFGVLTTDTLEQAFDRAGAKAGNKGAEAAVTAIEMASLGRKLKSHGL